MWIVAKGEINFLILECKDDEKFNQIKKWVKFDNTRKLRKATKNLWKLQGIRIKTYSYWKTKIIGLNI